MKEKRQPPPDALLIEGLAFRERETPQIVFASGLSYPFHPDVTHYGMVHLFGQMRLPYRHTRDRAYQYADQIGSNCGYLIGTSADNGLVIVGHADAECLIVTYDNERHQMQDVVPLFW